MSGLGLKIEDTTSIDTESMLAFIRWLLDNRYASGDGDLALSFKRYDPVTDAVTGESYEPRNFEEVRALVQTHGINPLSLTLRYDSAYDRSGGFDNRTTTLVDDLNRVAYATHEKRNDQHRLDFYGTVAVECTTWEQQGESGVSCNLSFQSEGSPLGSIDEYCQGFDATAEELSASYRDVKEAMRACFASPITLFFFDEGY